ncbi:MAG: amidohydrolase family protein [Pseudomonadota bacterium]
MTETPAPDHPPARPTTAFPKDACDTHLHMLGAPGEFRLADKRAEDPAPGLTFDDYVDRYRAVMETAGITRAVLVHSILYGTDNAVTFAAHDALGHDTTRVIALVTDDASDDHLTNLAQKGAVGIRLNYVHGGVLSWAGAKALAPKLADRGMHLQMLLNTDKHMAKVAADVEALPVPIVIDHIGWPDIAAGPDEPGFTTLRRLIGTGKVFVKLSGIYRLDDPPYDETDSFVAALVAENPAACLWGSDWPHIMLANAGMPPLSLLVDAFARAVPDEETRRQILVHNPAKLYGFAP